MSKIETLLKEGRRLANWVAEFPPWPDEACSRDEAKERAIANEQYVAWLRQNHDLLEELIRAQRAELERAESLVARGRGIAEDFAAGETVFLEEANRFEGNAAIDKLVGEYSE